ncbi:malonate--CoA ligase [Candidatus Thiosymbion oneisti]|uniref:malonate--CoA ligase n=1 Tax=Candidatus Thiosymbion oneisti TaxID=589554 RepID=UPI000A6AAC0E|nr:malonyl-CoA synthase [Candidatus Thiosymbion oneisti]
MNHNLFALFQTRFPRDLDRHFLETPEGRTLSYRGLEHQSACLQRVLKEQGIAPGDRVVVQIEKSPLALALYLACLRCGAVYVPLNTAYTPRELAYFLADAAPQVLVVRPEAVDELASAVAAAGVAQVLTLDADGNGSLATLADAGSPDHSVAIRNRHHLAAILYTSGTTGRSKGAMLTHDNLASNALALHRTWGFVPQDVLIHALPIFHVHGLFVATHCMLLNGSGMFFLPSFDADTIIDMFPRATVLMGVPTFYTRLLQHPQLTAARCAHMRLFIAGSAPLLPDTFKAFEQRTGQRILERYGMTEAGMITSNPLEGERVPGTVGFPLPGVEVRVCDRDGNRVIDAVGILEVRGPNLFKGYWRMPDKMATEFRADGFFITGDLATIDTHGRVAIIGRAKDLIISGGYNVYPKEVENAIDGIAGVDESAVIGLQHADLGEAVAAVVTLQPGADLDEAGLISRLQGKLARFKQPKKVIFVDTLPRNAMGKVQKNELRARFAHIRFET